VIISPGSGVPGCEETLSCFSPDVVIVQVGDSVTWINKDSLAHTVTSGTAADGPDGNFDSSVFMASFDFTVQFPQDGWYDYFCMLHPWATGSVLVTIEELDEPVQIPPYAPYVPTLDTDWESKYYDVLSKFNDVSARVGELGSENNLLRQQISELEKKVNDLNAIIMEQIKVIYDWVIGK